MKTTIVSAALLFSVLHTGSAQASTDQAPENINENASKALACFHSALSADEMTSLKNDLATQFKAGGLTSEQYISALTSTLLDKRDGCYAEIMGMPHDVLRGMRPLKEKHGHIKKYFDQETRLHIEEHARRTVLDSAKKIINAQDDTQQTETAHSTLNGLH